MKSYKIFTLAMIFILAITLQTVMADDGSKDLKIAEKPAENQMLKYKVPGLNKDMTMKIMEVLKTEKGLISAKPDFEKGTLTLILDGKMEAEKITKLLQTHINETEFISNTKAPETAKSKCGACPHQAKCNSEKKNVKTLEAKKLDTTGIKAEDN